jgi:soluble lytic murein transglycosylase-like protein
MRSVALSPFIDKQVSPGTQAQGAGRLTTTPNPAFLRFLETMQRANPSVVVPTSTPQSGPFSGSLTQPIGVEQLTAATNTPALLPSPMFTRDPRFLAPSSVGSVRRQAPENDALLPRERSPATVAQRAVVRTYGTAITATAQQFGVDPALSLAVARAESGVSSANAKDVQLNPRAVSSAGSAGLFQLQEATGKEQLRAVAPGQSYNPFNPHQNIQLGVSYLKEMEETFSEDTPLRNRTTTTAGANPQEVQRLAVAAYNAGPGRVARAQELARSHGLDPAHYRNIEHYLPHETRQYVKRVERFTAEFRGGDAPVTNGPTLVSDLMVNTGEG